MFQFSKRVVQVCTRIATIVLLLFAGFPVTNLPNRVDAADTSSCQWKWKRVPSPNAEARINSLRSLTVVDASDIWAVGYSVGTDDIAKTLIEHWNGRTWNIVPSPNAQSGTGTLLDVSAVSENNIWTVGYSYSNNVFQPLIEYWDGTAWKIVSLPNDLGYSYLSDITAVSSTDVWAVGGQSTSPTTPNRPLLLHWDGISWLRVPILEPNPPYGALLSSVALAPNSIWAVGGYRNSPPPTLNNTLTLHYDGTTWNQVPSPSESPGSHDNYLLSVSAISKDNIWAVGSSYRPKPPIIYPLIEHWDGLEWSIVSMPFQYVAGAQTRGVVAAPSGEVWAVGTNRSALIAYWNGTEWNDTSPNNGNGFFYNVVTVDDNTILAVGELTAGVNERQTLIIQGHRHCRKLPLCTDAPIMVAPAQDIVSTSVMVRLDWKNQKCATYYQVQVRRQSAQGKIVKREGHDRISEYIFSRLTPDWGNPFVWHVRACNNLGCGSWSEWRKFTIQTAESTR